MRDRPSKPRHAGFPLDRFQQRALDALDAGQHVLVAAPTGSGKTLVAEYAIDTGARRRRQGLLHHAAEGAVEPEVRRPRAACTARAAVGLLTGDNSVNGDAPIVVMTTEVLRNMIYAASPALDGLRYVVLDEVHYLQDRYRGPVWEEVIVHLAADGRPGVPVGHGVERRGGRRVDRDRARPAPRRSSRSTGRSTLEHRYLVGERGADALHLLPTFVDAGRPSSDPTPRRPGSTPRHAARRAARVAGRARRLRTPSRVEIVELLDAEEMLPAIDFVFSRAGCDQAVEQCLAAGLRLTDAGGARADPRDRRARRPSRSPTTTSTCSRYDQLARRARGGLRRAPRGDGAADEGGGGGGVRGRAWSRSCSRPRPSRSASTCRRARW